MSTMQDAGSRPKVFVLFRLNPAFYSFISAAFIAVSINLYTGIFASGEIPAIWPFLLTSSVLALVSAISWVIFALQIDRIRSLAWTDRPSEYQGAERLFERLVLRHIWKLRIVLSLSITTAILALVVLPFGLTQSRKEQITTIDVTQQVEPTEQSTIDVTQLVEPTEQSTIDNIS